MELRLTLVDAVGAGSCADLEVSAPDRACWGDLLDAVPETLLTDASAYDWYVGRASLGRDAPLGVAPLLDGAFVTNEPAPAGRSRRGPARGASGLLELHVVEGPDCGRIIRLPLGVLRIGRSGEADLQLHDPTLSRVHAELTVSHDGIRVRDLGTTNGSFLDDTLLPADGGARMSPGQRLSIGTSTVLIRLPHAVPAAVRPDRLGHLNVNRGPRAPIPIPDTTIRMPTRPSTPERLRAPVLTMALPLVLSIGVAAALHSPAMLLFGLMGPVMLMGSHLSDRRGRRHGSRRRQTDYVHDLASARAELASALAHEAHSRRRQHPDLAALLRTVRGPAANVWQRRPHDPDFLHLRVGSARLPATLTLVQSPGGQERREAVESHPLLSPVPVVAALLEVGILGLAGVREQVLGSARSLVGQLCGWHSPRDVQLVVLVAEPAHAADWAWAGWLPHTRTSGPRSFTRIGVANGDRTQVADRVAELTAQLDDRGAPGQPVATGPQAIPRPVVVVVLDGARQLRANAGLSRLLEHGPSVGICFVCLDTDLTQLPVETGASLSLSGQGTSASCRRRPDDEPLTCTPGLVSAGWIERFARALAPLRDATPAQDRAEPPESARLLDVLDLIGTDPTAIAGHWQTRPRTTSCTVGVSALGVQVVDLRREGPHALVGGTTGSGKSELLQTMIASLALGNRPDEMVFVLVDYKGGSAFKECARLPHTVGMVSDLDGHLTERALSSLDAELKRREHVLGSVGAKDLEEYQRISDATAPAMPRLVLIIDEFKMLAEELPDFVTGLVRIAAVGRSLGVHLILATQRPGGIVSADIKANVNLRIALRVRDKVDSDDVIEAPDAAAISERTPGRALMRSGGNAVQLFQAARVGGHAPMAADRPIRLRRLSPITMGDPAPPESFSRGQEATDLSRIVEAICRASAQLDLPQIASPWLPALTASPTVPPPEGTTPWQLPYAVADLPSEQSQPWVVWDLARDGHLAFAGSARSGRTTLVRTLVGSLVERCSWAEAHLYVFDGSGALRVLADLPHTGAVIGREETARGDRLLHRLLEEIGRRQQIWADLGYSSLTEQRAAGGVKVVTAGDTTAGGATAGASTAGDTTAGGATAGASTAGDATADEATASAATTGTGPLPYLVVVLDGWEIFAQAYEEVDHGRPVDAMLQVLREGPSVGVRAVVTGDRTVLLSRLASIIPERTCLRMADEADLLLAGLSAKSVPAQMPPGRGVRVLDSVELQVALLDTGARSAVIGPARPGTPAAPVGIPATAVADASGPAQVLALRRIVERCRDVARREPVTGSRPLRVAPLPRTITLTEAMHHQSPSMHPTKPASIVLGVGGDELTAVELPLTAHGLCFLVAGPAGSGRTTALALITQQLARLGRPLAVVAEGGSALLGSALLGSALLGSNTLLPQLTGLEPSDHRALNRALQEHPDVIAIVDDAERLAGTPTEDILVGLARSARHTGGGVVCSGSVHELLGIFRGLTVEVRKQQTGLLLCPSAPGDGELLGVRVTRCGQPVPGRGVHVTRGRSTDLQVALPR